MSVTFGARPVLILAASVATVAAGWLATRPNSTTVLFPYPQEASTPIDAPPDSSIDAPPDAPAQPIDLNTPWTMHTIYLGSLTGADGTDMADINGDGKLDVTTGFEESSKVVVALNPGCGAVSKNVWPAVELPSVGTLGPEDAVFADIDGDGSLDVVSAGQVGFKLVVFFSPTDHSKLLVSTAWTAVTIAAATNITRWTRVAIADFDHDGTLDVAACGDGVAAPQIDYYTSTTPRAGSSWTRHNIGPIGKCQEMVARDVNGDGWMDLMLSDDSTITSPAIRYDLRGSRWLENPKNSGGWTNHTIVPAPPPQDRWDWFSADARSTVHGTASGGANNVNAISHWSSADGITWTKDFDFPTPIANFGWYQDSLYQDVDADGLPDLVITGSNANGSIEPVVWLKNMGGNVFVKGQISGSPGCKYDNMRLYDVDCDGDLDLVTSSQLCSDGTEAPGFGMVWYENPRF